MDFKVFLLHLARIFVGSHWNRAGSFLIFAGVSVLIGWVDQLLSHVFGLSLKQNDTWVGFALIAIGVWMLWSGRITPEDEKARDQLRLAREPQLQRDFKKVGDKIFIEKARVALPLHNAGPLAIAYTIKDVTTIVEGQIA